MKQLLLLISISILFLGNASCESGSTSKAEIQASVQNRESKSQWNFLLRAFEKHTEDERRAVKKSAEESDVPADKKLAILLLSEWDLPRDSEILRYARPVDMPESLPLSGIVQGGVFALKVTVDANGNVTKADFFRPPDQRDLSKMILDRVSKAKFRPPLINSCFSSGIGIATLRIEIR